jgi:hypothetical protein
MIYNTRSHKLIIKSKIDPRTSKAENLCSIQHPTICEPSEVCAKHVGWQADNLPA